jgi:transposase
MSKGTQKKGALSKKNNTPVPKHLEQINLWAAGIDIGATSHFVAVPEGCDEKTVREFKSFTSDHEDLANWLKKCGIKTVAMESTGVYWIPLYELLEAKGFDVKLVDARQVKNVSGRKTDVLDCQWIQKLHTYGLLNAAFRPTEDICALRSYVRQRSTLIQNSSAHIQHMQKALTQMNLQLHHVISDLTGLTGMNIIRAIVDGERDPKLLATMRDGRCKSSVEIIERALTGHYRAEHLFALKQALELYDVYQGKIAACDQEIEKKLSEFATSEAGAPSEIPDSRVTTFNWR